MREWCIFAAHNGPVMLNVAHGAGRHEDALTASSGSAPDAAAIAPQRTSARPSLTIGSMLRQPSVVVGAMDSDGSNVPIELSPNSEYYCGALCSNCALLVVQCCVGCAVVWALAATLSRHVRHHLCLRQ